MFPPISYGQVVQLVRMPACHAGGRGFEPLLGRQHALVAQSVEQETENLRVGGSIPPQGTIVCGSSSVVECHLAKVDVASPNLVYRSTFFLTALDWNRIANGAGGCSSMVELQPSKLVTWVRFPSPAPLCAISSVGRAPDS